MIQSEEIVTRHVGDGDLQLIIEKGGGDIRIWIMPDDGESPTVELVNPAGGGGDSPETYFAACALFKAMQKDNEQRPQVR